jgi:hypothetical protein
LCSLKERIMSRKKIKPQESPVDAPPGVARKKEAKTSGGRKRTAKNPAAKSFPARNRVIAAVALVTMLIAATAILAQRGKQRVRTEQNHTEQVQNATQPAEELSPESLTSPSLWSKEYIHGPGGKVIATEERVTFTDVAEGSPFYEDIYRIAARGVTVGCGGGNFCADQNVTREQMAAFIMRALGEFSPPTPPSQRFNDVPPTNIFYSFIDRMGALGITVGCGNGNYCPGSAVLHQEMAAFIMRARSEFDPPTPPTQRFNDVLPSNVFYNFIERMGALDIWQGQGCPQGPGYYCPGAFVTRRQMAHILVKAFGI